MRILARNFHAGSDSQPGYAARASVQTGDRPEDPRLEADIVFTTIDQALSSFLLAPYGLSYRSANLNAGAVASSYLVFDEFHLFDPD